MAYLDGCLREKAHCEITGSVDIEVFHELLKVALFIGQPRNFVRNVWPLNIEFVGPLELERLRLLAALKF